MRNTFYRNALAKLKLKLPVREVDSESNTEGFLANIAVILFLFYLAALVGDFWATIGITGLVALVGLFAYAVLRVTLAERLRGQRILYAYFFSSIVLPILLLCLVLNSSDHAADGVEFYLLDGGVAWLWLLWFRLRPSSLRPLEFAALHQLTLLGFLWATFGAEETLTLLFCLTVIIKMIFLWIAWRRAANLKRFLRW